MKWWLVSEDDLNEVCTILKEAIEHVNYSQPYRNALHTLETGMHKTDAVPADFAEPRVDTGAGTEGE